MKLFGHFLSVWLSKEHCSRIRICVSIWLLRQMTSHLFLLILSSLAVSLQLGLEDVFFNPQDQMVREGEEVFFQCVSGESSPPASITWLKDGALVTTARQFQGAYGGGDEKKTSGTLHLFNATTVDDGMYICVTHNALLNTSKRSKPAKLTVQGVPKRLQITDGPDNITAAIGTDVSMRCTVYGFPVPMVHWFKDSCPLNNCSTCSTSFILHNNGQLLTFRNLTREDEGFYHCEASNQKETIKSLSAYLLPAEMDWVFIQNPTNRTVKKGENVTFTCRPPYSRPEAQVSWFKNNKPIIPTASTTLLPNGDLFIHSVQEQDSGSYFCRASNIHLRRFLSSRRAVITVLAPPSAQLWPQALTVPLGGRVLLQCQVSGNPQPTITWVKRGHSKQTGGKFILGLRNTTLYIQSARKYDEGLYVCVASNTLGQSHNASLLRVAVSPIIVTFVGEVRCRIGASAVLPCRAVGILPITYSWSRGGAETQSPVTPTEGTHIDENGTLHISNVQYYHDGEYYCTAENRAGRHQRFTILKVTAGHQDGDRSNQTRHLSVGRITSKAPTISQFTDVPRQHRKRTPVLQVHQQHDKTTCSLFHCGTTTMRATTYSTYYQGAVAELEIPQRSLGQLLQHNLYQPMTVSPQPFMTQMQPPTFQPLSTQLYTQIPVTTDPLSISSGEPLLSAVSEVSATALNLASERQTPLTLTSSQAKFDHQINIHAWPSASEVAQFITDWYMSQPLSTLPVSRPFAFLNLDSYPLTPTESVLTQSKTTYSAAQSFPPQVEFHQTPSSQLFTKSSSALIHQTKVKNLDKPLPWITQSSTTLSQTFQVLLSQKNRQYLPALPKPTTSMSILTEIQPRSMTQYPLLNSQTPPPHTDSFPFHHRDHLRTQPSISAVHPPDQTSDSSASLDPEIPGIHLVNMSDQVQLNFSNQGDSVKSAKSANDTELIDFLKRNTSQSPMTSNDPRVTQQSPSWLPVLEKHDIPIVVGVGVSLAFIFITVTFYSLVQKNDPLPTSRAAQRNVGVPMRHTERRVAGRTYENRAFEDDECVAVIEQNPNTSDTRAQPPGPSLVTVQIEPTFEDFQEDTQPGPESQALTVETYPEPILDTKIDLAEDEMSSLSQPSIQLQCADDWTSNRGDNHSPCQDALPPPSSLPTRSPSPSPPLRQMEGLHSSLTVQNTEMCAAPIHHSLSISPGNPPLFLSHHVSLGPTTVAVDVHLYPTATATVAVGTNTQLNSVSNSNSMTAPLFTSSLVNSQDNEQLGFRSRQSK